MTLTASDLVSEIAKLPRGVDFSYPNARTKTLVRIVGIDLPEGPIWIERDGSGRRESISTNAIWKAANALANGRLVNLDAVYKSSYNFRSAFEALLVITPHIFMCYPNRIDVKGSTFELKKGHKHIFIDLNRSHPTGEIAVEETDKVVHSVENATVEFEGIDLVIPPTIDIDLARRHTQMQVALIEVGKQLNMNTWIAVEDRHILYGGKRIDELDGVMKNLSDHPIFTLPYEEAINIAKHIDAIWIDDKGPKLFFEVEHSTGIMSGIVRMKNFKEKFIGIDARYVIVADDTEREAVFKKSNEHYAEGLELYFLPYSALEEIYSLCQRRGIKGIPFNFIYSFMERCN